MQNKDDRCYFCPKRTDLEDHHIIPQRFDGPDSDDNIVRVCNRCHKKLERLYDKAFYEWFGIEDNTGKRTFHQPCNGANCDSGAEVKLSIPGRNLVCADCAAWVVVDKYIRLLENEEKRYASSPPDSIEKFWNQKVIETESDVDVPDDLNRKCAIMATERL